jgi:hypothetical protein
VSESTWARLAADELLTRVGTLESSEPARLSFENQNMLLRDKAGAVPPAASHV